PPTLVLLLSPCASPPSLHSFPTRRSSDLCRVSFGLVALHECHDDLGSRLGHGFDRLRNRVVLIAGNNALNGGDFGVVSSNRRQRVYTRCFQGGNRAAGSTVIGGHHACYLSAIFRDLTGHPILGLLRVPIRRIVFGQN